MRFVLFTLSVALLMSFHGGHCHAVSLKTSELVPDGSAEPAGDRIDFAVQFEQGESSIELTVRGFRVDGKQNTNVTFLGAASKNGILHLQEIISVGTAAVTRGSIVIPYGDLQLPPGTHFIAYEIIGKANGKVVFVRPTALTQLVVSTNVRRQMTVTETRYDRAVVERAQQVRIAGQSGRGKPANPELKQAALKTPVDQAVTKTKIAAVEIPGEFLRSEVVPIATPNTSDSKGLGTQGWRSLSELEEDGKREIWFASNRAAIDEPGARLPFGPNVSEVVRYGRCVVSVPIQNHRKGDLEMPSWWSRRDPDKHFVIDKLTTFDKQDFQDSFAEGDALLFIHGFYTTFQDAIYRTAQLKHDLDFDGPSMAFSWPSAGKISEYEADQKNADASVDALVNVIATLAGSLKNVDGRKSKIHVIAHSMGNRLLLQAMYKINQAKTDYFPQSPIGQVVLAAPDVGAIMFNNLSPHVIDLSDQVTYYYCGGDTALATSREINKYEPVGLMPYFDDGLNTINANGVGTSFIGHSYYASSREVLSDVELILKRGARPDDRMPPLAFVTQVFGHQCWSFVETRD